MKDTRKGFAAVDTYDDATLCWECVAERAADDRNGDEDRFVEANVWDCDDAQQRADDAGMFYDLRCDDCGRVVWRFTAERAEAE